MTLTPVVKVLEENPPKNPEKAKKVMEAIDNVIEVIHVLKKND